MNLPHIDRMNLHNHSVFSDGAFKAAEIVRMAEKSCQLDIIGICDHFQTKKIWEFSLDPGAILDYIEQIRWIGRTRSIRVLVGLEIDFSPRTELETLPLETLNHLDFVLFEYVNSQHWRGYSLNKLIPLREQLEIPVGLAHSDFRRDLWKGKQDNQVLYALADAEIFLELAPGSRNREMTASGPLPYYKLVCGLFTEVREKAIPIRFSIGTDTHSDLSEVCATKDAEEFLDHYQLLTHLISF